MKKILFSLLLAMCGLSASEDIETGMRGNEQSDIAVLFFSPLNVGILVACVSANSVMSLANHFSDTYYHFHSFNSGLMMMNGIVLASQLVFFVANSPCRKKSQFE